MKNFHTDKDNFNRHLKWVSRDVDVNWCQGIECSPEFMWNAEDALRVDWIKGLRRKLRLVTNPPICTEINPCRSLIIDSTMDADTAKQERLEHAVRNPDPVVSPVSLASRLNMGFAMEGLKLEKRKIRQIWWSQRWDHTSGLYDPSLKQLNTSPKIMDKKELSEIFNLVPLCFIIKKSWRWPYRKGLSNEEVRNHRIDEAATHFDRLGISQGRKALPGKTMWMAFVPDRVTVDAPWLFIQIPSGCPFVPYQSDGKILSTLTWVTCTWQVRWRVNHLLMNPDATFDCVPEGETIPYRYTEVFQTPAVGKRTRSTSCLQ